MDINRFCLGTVQLGKIYGINNKTGLLKEKEVFDLLDEAYDKGLRQFDTAADYGRAETILGRYIKNRKFTDNINIISKLPYKIHDNVVYHAKASLRKLNINRFYGLMFHNPDSIYDKKLIEQLQKTKQSKLTKYIGVSVYEPKQALDAVKSNWVNIIQIPYNILDQRLNNTEFFNLARQRNIKIYARSSFLQGLLLMDYKSIPENLQGIIPYLKKLDTFLADENMSRKQAAISFSYSNEAIDSIVFGVDNKEQLIDYLEIIKDDKGIATIKNLNSYFGEVEERLINPSKW